MIDTHVHLNDPQLYQKYETVMAEAIAVGVNQFIVIGYDLPSSKLAIELANKHANIWAAIGFHPTEIKSYSDVEYEWLLENAKALKVVAIGECGYDLHWDTTTAEEQESAFIKQIAIAKMVNKPLIIHSRDAHELTLKTLKENGADQVGGIMHAYSGSLEMAHEYVKMHFYFGIGGPVTFTNAKEIKRVVAGIDCKYLLTETDSPYLTPHPYRGQENGPRYIPLIVAKIAEIKEMNPEDVAATVQENANRLFKF